MVQILTNPTVVNHLAKHMCIKLTPLHTLNVQSTICKSYLNIAGKGNKYEIKCFSSGHKILSHLALDIRISLQIDTS